LQNLWSRKKVTKKAHAGRGQETKWEIAIETKNSDMTMGVAMKPLIFLRILIPLTLLGAFCPVALAGGIGTVSYRPVNDEQEPLQSDIGEIYVSFVGERSLDEVIDDLQPQFQITPQTAFQMAVPDTKSTLESALSAFSGSLQLGLTSSSPSASVPTNVAPAATQTQSQTPPGSQTNLLNTPLSMDAASEYQAAASLYEQVKLMNQSLKAVPRFKGYDAFIVTIQVTLIPYQRNAAYDAYADLSFFCGTTEAPAAPTVESEDMPIILPIITSDELEAASDQQSINNLTSISLALSAAFHGIGAQAALSQLNQNLDTILGNNLNSLLTVGKINANTVAVRLGARNSIGSKAGLSMVPEVHNITFLVLARHEENELEIISRVVLRHAGNGNVLLNPLKALGQKMKDEFTSDIFGPYLGLTSEEVQGLLCTPQARENAWDVELAMMNDTTTYSNFPSAFTDFRRQLTSYFGEPTNFDMCYVNKHTNALETARDSINQFNVVTYDSLWMDVARIQALGNPYANDLIPLTHWEPVLPSTNQLVLYTDDGQSATTFTMNGGKNISSAATKMSAVLTVTNNVVLNSDQVQIVGNDVKVMFPSLASIGYSNNPSRLDIILDENSETNITDSYINFAQVKMSPVAPKPAWSIARTYGFLTSSAVSNQFSIVLAANPANTNATGYLDIENPIVLSYWPTNGVIAGQVNGLFALQPATNTMVTFTFGQLMTGQTVSFNLLDQSQKFVSTLGQQVVYPSGSSSVQASTPAGGGGKGSGQ
jgi:hypothetical protein